MSESGPPGAGVLFVVATPIGNAGDISPRALEVLRTADLIACEDTRRTASLLAAHRITTPRLSYFEHNEERRIPALLARLAAGAKIALVADAGTPAISDPGLRLVRAAHRENIRVVAVPGPSAVIAALSIAGLPTDRFTFEGFLPARPAARRAALHALAAETRTMVFLEAARRLPQTLGEMAMCFGPEREAVVLRELTKTWEETIRAPLAEMVRRFENEPPRGEVTLVIEGCVSERAAHPDAPALSTEQLVAAGLSLKQASSVIARLTGRSSREVYQEAIKTREPR